MTKVLPFSSKLDDEPQTSYAAVASASGAELFIEGPTPSWNSETEQLLLLLAQRLMSCIEVERLLLNFFQWSKDLNLAEGLSYVGAEDTHQLSHGPRRHHSATYALSLDGADLGNITLHRRERYGEHELFTIERALGMLAPMLRHAIEFANLQKLVTHDPLTGLGNRNSLKRCIERELSRSRRHDCSLALLMIDVDHFKKLNDELGHLGGDRVLQGIATLLRTSCRESDLLFRFGGDEFTVLLPHTDYTGAIEAARQIRTNMAEASLGEFGIDPTANCPRPDVSIGISNYQPGDNEESLLQRADTGLYHAKARGRGAICNNV